MKPILWFISMAVLNRQRCSVPCSPGDWIYPTRTIFSGCLKTGSRLRRQGGGKPIILIFDDAHRLNDSILKEIYRLTEIQVNMKRILNIVLCAESALEQRLRREKQFRQLLLQVSHRFYLQPMDADTINRFLILYLQQAGKTGLQLEAAAPPTFYKLSKGFPGMATRLCQLVVDARQEETDLWAVSKTELENLVQRSAPVQSRIRGFFRKANAWSVAGPIAAVLLILALVLLYQIAQSS